MLFFFFATRWPSTLFAESAPTAELENILQKIESRHYRWIGIRADVLLFFAKASDPNAMCGGELLYQRLDERMFLTCVDARQELMFVFRTLDRRFDLYLPSQNTVYHGSIFDLEDSPDIESHLKARDLYRALKPLSVDPGRTKVERTNFAITSLDVYGREENAGTLLRKLYLTPEGDVRGELFYDPEGRPVTEIQRYDFREIRGRAGAYDSVIFPKKITIISPKTKKGSAIFFTRVTALDTIDPLEFILRVPDGTKEVFLEEKDPRFQTSETSESEARLVPKTARFQNPKTSGSETRPGPKADRFQYPKKSGTKTLPVPKTTRLTPLTPAKKLPEKKILQELPQEKIPEAPKPAAVPAPPVPAKTDTSENADADIVTDEQPATEPSSASYAQTTLDPSVEAAL